MGQERIDFPTNQTTQDSAGKSCRRWPNESWGQTEKAGVKDEQREESGPGWEEAEASKV